MSKLIVAEMAILESEATDIYAKIRSMSITPTAFEARSYSAGLGDIVFKETYAHSGNQVVRFGINTKAIPTAELSALPNPVTLAAGGAGGSVRSAGSAYSIKEVNEIIHHNAEIQALQNAINYLFDSSTPGHTAVVDILVRNKGVVKLPAEVHSVTLYKNPPNHSTGKSEVIVIDPSNFTYSSHLSNPDILSHVGHANLEKISTFHKPIQIYKPKTSDIGPSIAQYRDCVDIAVKIALNLSSATHPIESKKIDRETEVIKLSNTELDENFTTVIAPVRVKQSSELSHVNTFYELEGSLSKKIGLLRFCEEQANDRIAAYSDSALDSVRGLDGEALHATLDGIRLARKAVHEPRYASIVSKVEELILKADTNFKMIMEHDAYLGALRSLDTEISGEMPGLYATLDL